MRALVEILIFFWRQPWLLIVAGLMNLAMRFWTGYDFFVWEASAVAVFVGAALTVARWKGVIE